MVRRLGRGSHTPRFKMGSFKYLHHVRFLAGLFNQGVGRFWPILGTSLILVYSSIAEAYQIIKY